MGLNCLLMSKPTTARALLKKALWVSGETMPPLSPIDQLSVNFVPEFTVSCAVRLPTVMTHKSSNIDFFMFFLLKRLKVSLLIGKKKRINGF